MKRNIFAVALVSTLLAGAAGTAMASDAYPEGSQFAWVPQTSVLSRAQVNAELASAQAQGLAVQTDAVYPALVAQGPAKTRAAVKAELAQAQAQGLLAQTDTVYPRVPVQGVAANTELAQTAGQTPVQQ